MWRKELIGEGRSRVLVMIVRRCVGRTCHFVKLDRSFGDCFADTVQMGCRCFTEECSEYKYLLSFDQDDLPLNVVLRVVDVS